MSPAEKAVIFEVSGVLVKWYPVAVYRKLVPRNDELRAYFLEEVSRAPWDDRPVRDGAFEEGVRRLLEGIVPEAEAGVPASHPMFYENVLRRFGLRAEDCLYVDRSEENAAAAESAGIAAHRYTWITPLRRELRARGFLPVPPILQP